MIAADRLNGAPTLDPTRLDACRRRFLDRHPGGFHDPEYVETVRDYKWRAHRQWSETLNRRSFRSMLEDGRHADIADTAMRIESATDLLFSFEKTALGEALRSDKEAHLFAECLYAWLHGSGGGQARFGLWCETVAQLPRAEAPVATWPVLTVFGFIARPTVHLFVKPTATERTAEACGYDFCFHPRPQWETYANLVHFAKSLRTALADLGPRDMIDIQSFIGLQGSSDYDE